MQPSFSLDHADCLLLFGGITYFARSLTRSLGVNFKPYAHGAAYFVVPFESCYWCVPYVKRPCSVVGCDEALFSLGRCFRHRSGCGAVVSRKLSVCKRKKCRSHDDFYRLPCALSSVLEKAASSADTAWFSQLCSFQLSFIYYDFSKIDSVVSFFERGEPLSLVSVVLAAKAFSALPDLSLRLRVGGQYHFVRVADATVALSDLGIVSSRLALPFMGWGRSCSFLSGRQFLVYKVSPDCETYVITFGGEIEGRSVMFRKVGAIHGSGVGLREGHASTTGPIS